MDIRDRRPEEMEAYLSNFGWHFNKKMCEFAVSLMKKLNPSTGKKERIEPISKEKVDELLTRYGIKLENKPCRFALVFTASLTVIILSAGANASS